MLSLVKRRYFIPTIIFNKLMQKATYNKYAVGDVLT